MNGQVRERNWGRQAPWLILALVAFSGCAPARGTISGKVLYRGQPLKGGTVQFFSEDQSVASGLLDANGYYQVANVHPGQARVSVVANAAVPLGLRRVNRTAPAAARFSKASPGTMNLDKVDGRPPRIPARYASPEQSGLALLVRGGDQAFDIEIQSEKAR
jgi:hypothetical protein